MCVLRSAALGRKAEPLVKSAMLEKKIKAKGSPACWPNVPPSREGREDHHPKSPG